MFDLRKNTPVTPEVLVLQRDWDVFFGKGFLQNIQLVRAPSVSMRSYVGTKLVLDFRIKKIIRASGLQTRSIFNRVQVLRILLFEFGEFEFKFEALDFVGRNGMNK